jgi:hypothetical protein
LVNIQYSTTTNVVQPEYATGRKYRLVSLKSFFHHRGSTYKQLNCQVFHVM